jgi:GNAT superfamily N-acetyltransferase
MIRTAQTYADVRMVAEYMKQFEQATEYVKVDVEYTSSAYWDLVQDGVATLFIMEESGQMIGGLGAIKYPDLHDGKMMAVESFWFVAPEHRGKGLKLFATFEEWALQEGCKKLAMIHMVDSYPDILEKLYMRKGYKLVEKHYVREV